MIEFNRIFIDTAPFIYLLDDDVNFRPAVENIFIELLSAGTEIITSTITLEEYLVYPYRTNNLEKETAFYEFCIYCNISTHEITKEIAKKAARIRAKYRSFKAMDALQLAVACLTDCDLFLTNDNQLLQFNEIKCTTVNGFFEGDRQ